MAANGKAPLYLIPFPLQRAQISAWCWGAGCGQGCIGALTLDGHTFICCNEAACPHVEKQMAEPVGEYNGRPCIPRKLRKVTPQSANGGTTT